MSRRLVLVLACVTFANVVIAAQAVGRYGVMPNWWAGWKQVSIGTTAPGMTNSLGGVVGQVQHEALPNGGPQALEGFTYDDHATGVTRLTMGVIGNVELAGAGRTVDVRPV